MKTEFEHLVIDNNFLYKVGGNYSNIVYKEIKDRLLTINVIFNQSVYYNSDRSHMSLTRFPYIGNLSTESATNYVNILFDGIRMYHAPSLLFLCDYKEKMLYLVAALKLKNENIDKGKNLVKLNSFIDIKDLVYPHLEILIDKDAYIESQTETEVGKALKKIFLSYRRKSNLLNIPMIIKDQLHEYVIPLFINPKEFEVPTISKYDHNETNQKLLEDRIISNNKLLHVERQIYN